jgi:hypothetical protein
LVGRINSDKVPEPDLHTLKSVFGMASLLKQEGGFFIPYWYDPELNFVNN